MNAPATALTRSTGGPWSCYGADLREQRAGSRSQEPHRPGRHERHGTGRHHPAAVRAGRVPIGTPGFDRPDAGDATRLWNIAARIPAEHRFSRRHGGEKELIDHILLSHDLIQNLAGADTYTQDITTIGNTPSSRRDATVPDHAPVTATIN